VAPGSLVQRSGLRRGDIILAVNNEPVESLSQFNEKIEKAKKRTENKGAPFDKERRKQPICGALFEVKV
jgi:S1-C subfamily serine protease